jgi:ribose transport system ATP-binding protein
VARELKGDHLSADALVAASMNVHLQAEAQT